MLDKFLAAEKKKVELVRFDFGDMGNWYEVRHMQYKPYMTEFDRIQNKYAKYKKGGQPINEQKERNDMANAFVRHILTDWKFTGTTSVLKKAFPDIEIISIKGEKGMSEVPYTKENAYNILKDKRMAELFGFMVINCAEKSYFVEENFEDDLKNS
jgi:cysteine synthase